MLNEPILGLLPASEESIVEAWPKVCPDVILGNLHRLRRDGVIRRDSIGLYRPVVDSEPDYSKHKGAVKPIGNKNPKSRATEKTCECCGTTYLGVRKHFGTHARYCKACNNSGRGRNRAAQAAIKTRTCPSCGVTYTGVVENFKRAGRLRDTCNPCGQKAVLERIAARRRKAIDDDIKAYGARA